MMLNAYLAGFWVGLGAGLPFFIRWHTNGKLSKSRHQFVVDVMLFVFLGGVVVGGLLHPETEWNAVLLGAGWDTLVLSGKSER
jgi:hypothetical protein